MGIEVEPLTACLGAEVRGVDMADVDADTFGELHEAFLEHKVLFFRDQHITAGEHITFGRMWGELEIHPFVPDDGTHPEILVIESTPEQNYSASQWHSDVTFRQEPALGSILRGRIVPPVGGDTVWADTCAAYEALSDEWKERVDDLVAVHDFVRTFGNRLSPAELEQKREEYPVAEHPVIRTHPETGQRGIYVNRVFTDHIKDVEPTESAEIIERLTSQVYRNPSWQVRFRWQVDSFAMWDNRCTQHFATSDFFPGHRRVERVTIAGDKPY